MGIETDYGLFHISNFKNKNPHIAMHTADIDLAFEHSRTYLETQMTNLDQKLYKKKDSLFFDKKTQLHTLSEEQREQDIKTLDFLINLTTQAISEPERRHRELKKICILHQINNPIIGKE